MGQGLEDRTLDKYITINDSKTNESIYNAARNGLKTHDSS